MGTPACAVRLCIWGRQGSGGRRGRRPSARSQLITAIGAPWLVCHSHGTSTVAKKRLVVVWRCEGCTAAASLVGAPHARSVLASQPADGGRGRGGEAGEAPPLPPLSPPSHTPCPFLSLAGPPLLSLSTLKAPGGVTACARACVRAVAAGAVARRRSGGSWCGWWRRTSARAPGAGCVARAACGYHASTLYSSERGSWRDSCRHRRRRRHRQQRPCTPSTTAGRPSRQRA